MLSKNFEQVKYAFFDVDGTILNENLEVPKELLNCISELKKNNVISIICTGRSLPSMKELWDKWSLGEVFYHKFICNNGNCIYDTRLGEAHILREIDLEKFEKLVEKYKEVCRWVINTSNRIIYSDKFALMEYKMLFLSSNNQVIQCELSEVRTSIQGDEILEIYVFIEESDADKYVFESLGLKKMHYKRGFFYPSDVTKVEGVESLLSKDFHEISLDSIIVFGDGKNDYSLFKKSKISIAMQKSDKILKEVATECLIDQTLSQYLNKICVVQS